MTNGTLLTRLFIGLVIILMSISLFPFELIRENISADNPDRCQYYISLQTLLSNYPLMSFDEANVSYIKHRIQSFELNMKSNNKEAAAVLEYNKAYKNVLNKFNVSSIENVVQKNDILNVARNTFAIIDRYYFDNRVSCVNPLYDWKVNHSRRILNYNLGGLYLDQIKDKYARILFAVDSGVQLGAYSEYFVNNQTTTLVTQFMTGMPLLTALYVLPYYNFDKIGTYYGLVPWCAFWPGYVSETNLRKIMNIAGIDVFTVSKTDLAKRNIKLSKTNNFFNTTAVENKIDQRFGKDYIQLTNLDSYGAVYLADNITIADSLETYEQEKRIRQFFAKPEKRNPGRFTAATNILYAHLMALKNKHDILLETDSHQLTKKSNIQQGTAVVKGILGERALFEDDCNRDSCIFVWNLSKAPGWHAYVNGVSTPIERANYAFMAIKVPHGHSKVWFIYEPGYSLLSYFISILTLLGILLYTSRKR